MQLVATRHSTLAPPPHVVHESLLQPDRDPTRPWLVLHVDELRPVVLRAEAPYLLVWSFLWPDRPQDAVRLDLAAVHGGGTRLRWTWLSAAAPPGPARVREVRARLGQLLFGRLRETYDQ